MRKITLTAVALAALAFTLAGSRPGHAYYDGPWCGVSSMGRGGAIEKCDYRTFEACRMDTIAGNRGFCRPNGYYQGYASGAPRGRKARKHVRR